MSESVDFVYSVDGVMFFTHEEIMDDLENGNELGARVVIFRGVPVEVRHADYVRDLSIIEMVQNIAYDDENDMADDYLVDVTEEQEKTLLEEVVKLFDDMFPQPGYYRVVDIEEIVVTVGDSE